MIIDDNIDYDNVAQVKKILADIREGLKQNDITHYKISEYLFINKATFSQFLAGKQYHVNEDRIRKTVAYINKRHGL